MMEARDYSSKDSMFFSFQGRINRLSFFLRLIALIVVSVLAALGIGLFTGFLAMLGPLGAIFGVIIVVLFVLLVWIASLSLYVRRLHDMNLSGMLVFGYVVLSLLIGALEFAALSPEIEKIRLVFNILVIISFMFLLFWPGSKGPNKFGGDPLHNTVYLDEIFGDGKPQPDHANEYAPVYLQAKAANEPDKNTSEF